MKEIKKLKIKKLQLMIYPLLYKKVKFLVFWVLMVLVKQQPLKY